MDLVPHLCSVALIAGVTKLYWPGFNRGFRRKALGRACSRESGVELATSSRRDVAETDFFSTTMILTVPEITPCR